MENQENTHQCAMVEKGGKCCDGLAMQSSESMAMHKSEGMMQGGGRCIPALVFGALVIVGLATIIVYQAKILKALRKTGKKK